MIAGRDPANTASTLGSIEGMPSHVRIATPDDLGVLAAIETAADERFNDAFGGIEWGAATGTERASHPGFILVAAETPDGPIIGFAHVLEVDEIAHLEQLSVLPAFGRQGHGGALLHAAIDEASARGYKTLTLRTYADVPWNAGFYRAHGFEDHQPAPHTFYDELLATELHMGLEEHGPRVTMILELGGGGMHLEAEAFEALVVDELDQLPDEMVNDLENVIFVVEDRPEDGSLDLLGLYEGLAITERGSYGMGELPDRIVLYREPHLAQCRTIEELRDEIHTTLVHEIAHYYGIDDHHLHELGWA